MSWKRVPLEKLCLRITKGSTPTTLGRSFTSSGVNFIKAESLNGDSELDENGFAFIDDETHNSLLKRSILAVDDVLVTIAGAKIGACGRVKEKHLPANTNQAVGIIRVDSEKANPLFVYYFFKQKDTYQFVQRLNAQAAQPNINLATLGAIEIPLPDLDVQKRTVEAIFVYDELIATNQRRIALLEDAARRLYREWFVHLRFHGHESVPVKDGVPEGWERKPLGEIAPLNYGKALKSTDRKEGNVPVYGSSGVVGTHNVALVESGAIVVGRKGNVGSLYFSPVPCFPIDTVYYIAPAQASYRLFLALHQLNFISSDSAVPGLNRTYAHSLPVLQPSDDVAEAFERLVRPAFEQVQQLTEQNAKVAKARDLLLPKLMSGQLDVSGIRLPEEVAA